MRAALIALLLLTTSAGADPARLAEEAASKMSEAAEALGGDGDRVRALARALEAFQDGRAILREALRQTEAETARIEADLAGGDADLAQSAALLVRLERLPQEVLTLHPGGPLAALRAGRMASHVVERTGRRTARLAAARGELRDTHALRDALLTRFDEAAREIRATRRALLTTSAESAPEVPPTDIAILTALLDASDSLDALARAFAAAPADAVDLTALRLPVEGEVRADGAGISIDTSAGAVLRAPARATIRYAGPAPGAPGETTLLIEPAPGHLVILSGSLDPLVAPGQIVDEAAPVGLMRLSVAVESATDDPSVNESETGTGQRPPESLYIEWREGGAPVDISGRFRLP